MYDSILYLQLDQPQTSKIDYLLRWYQRELATATTAEARAAVVRNARNDGYTAAQFAEVSK